jgi:hypothetical protein
MIQGILKKRPQIKDVKNQWGKLSILLEDGRNITIQKKYFLFLKNPAGKIFIADKEVIVFDKADEVIHIEEILGRWEDYRYKG